MKKILSESEINTLKIARAKSSKEYYETNHENGIAVRRSYYQKNKDVLNSVEREKRACRKRMNNLSSYRSLLINKSIRRGDPDMYRGKIKELSLELETEKKILEKLGVDTRSGIYVIKKSGVVVKYTKSRNFKKEDVSALMVKDGKDRVAIGLKDLNYGDPTLLTVEQNDDPYYPFYKKGFKEAIYDFKGKENTRHIRDIGVFRYAVDVRPGWHIPSLGEMKIIKRNIEQINSVLSKLGKAFNESYPYWTSSEVNALECWCTNVYTGDDTINIKNENTSLVRLAKDLNF